MEIGVCVASHIGDIDYVVRAEELGFSHAWLADSQMIWSDCYATLALAASRTERIRLGTGIAVTGTRPAPVTAAAAPPQFCRRVWPGVFNSAPLGGCIVLAPRGALGAAFRK